MYSEYIDYIFFTRAQSVRVCVLLVYSSRSQWKSKTWKIQRRIYGEDMLMTSHFDQIGCFQLHVCFFLSSMYEYGY